ncbi:hypothetical protein NHX12_015048 [Muraenolepis orangiensis]|uniref:Uncharacterized protein n=1 Tax=Muraenolepis orangiensis TaxID=630683 RepID=A0A9Q0DBG7_9TELE|nr:hypothetical protein NHX12_015048 [Muraenolepis orangiensis]
MLIKDTDKPGAQGLHGDVSCRRQEKEALFLRRVQGHADEESADCLQGRQRLGQTPVTGDRKRQILEERAVVPHEYTMERDDGRQEDSVFAAGPSRPISGRLLRDARQVVEGAPCFQFYCSTQLLVRLRVVLRCRMNRRLAGLRKWTACLKESPHREQDPAKEVGGLLVSSDKILPFSFHVGDDIADQLLQVPQHFKVMGYRPPSAWEAFNSYVPPSLARPLRTGALDELLPEVTWAPAPGSVRSPRAREETRLQPVPSNPIWIFNPVPGLRVYKPVPKYLETSPEVHLCPLPRFTDNATKKPTYLDRKEVIKGVMTWKSSDWTTLRCLSQLPALSTAASGERTSGRSLDLKTDLIPERAPPPLSGPSDHMAAALVDRLPEEPVVWLTPDMIRAEFLGDDKIQ